MGLFSKEVRILLVMVVFGAAVVVTLVRYTDICRLQAVTINGEKVTHVQMLGLAANKPIVQQPLDSLADALMTQQGIVQVDIDYKLPNTLRITTNSLDPQCYLLDAVTGGIYGLEETGRIVTVDYEKIDWDAPLFTGVRVKRIHDFPADARVSVFLRQLQKLRQTNEPLYRQIEEIDLSRAEFALVTLANKQYCLKIRPEEFSDRYAEFGQFMTRFHPETDSVTSFDLTYAGMIIRQGYVEPPEKSVIDTSEVNDKASLLDESEVEADEPEVPVQPRVQAHAPEPTAAQLAAQSAKRTSGSAAKTSKASASGKSALAAHKTSKAKSGAVAQKNLKAKPGYRLGKLTPTNKSKAKGKAAPSPKLAVKKPAKKPAKTTKNG